MKNALIYNFNIYVDELTKLNDDYYFKFQNTDFVISLYNRNIDEIMSIYKLNIYMLKNNIPTYQIILTKDNNILFMYENLYYILMIIPNLKNRLITFDDIIRFNYIFDDKDIFKLDKSNWAYYWGNKIDYIEDQCSYLNNKYSFINNSFDYFLGLWENGISYFNYNNLDSKSIKCICHKRVGLDTDLYYFFNPLNLLIDYKERDYGEFLKSYVYSKNWTINELDDIFDKMNLNREDIMILITRILFPSYYFDLYEDIIIDSKRKDEVLKKINCKNIITLLKYIFDKYKFYNIPLIEWIKKEE